MQSMYIHTYLVIHKYVHNTTLKDTYPCGDSCELVTIRPTDSLLKQEHFLSLVPPFMAWGPYGCNTRRDLIHPSTCGRVYVSEH